MLVVDKLTSCQFVQINYSFIDTLLIATIKELNDIVLIFGFMDLEKLFIKVHLSRRWAISAKTIMFVITW